MDSLEPEDETRLSLKFRLIEVATALLAEPRSLKLPTMRQIAKAAGVAPGAAYRHFASQSELFMAVVSLLFSQLESAILEATQGVTDPRIAVRKVVNAYISWGLKNPGGYQLLFEVTDDEALFVSDERPGLHLIDQLAALISGKAIPDKTDIEQATRVWVSAHGLVSLRSHKTGMTWKNDVETEAELLLDALLSPSARVPDSSRTDPKGDHLGLQNPS